MELGGAPPEQVGGVEVGADGIGDLVGGPGLGGQIGRPRREVGELLGHGAGGVLVVEGELVEGVVPRVTLVGHVGVEHTERARLGAHAPLVLEGPEERRGVGEVGLGEIPADLQIGIHTLLGPTEHLHDQPTAEHGRAVALLGSEELHAEVVGGGVGQRLAEPRGGRRAHLGVAEGAERPTPPEGVQRPGHEVLVDEGVVEEEPLPPTTGLDPRHAAVGMVGQELVGPTGVSHRHRQHVGLGLTLGVLDLGEQHEGLGSAPTGGQGDDVDRLDGADRAGLAGVPAVASQELGQRPLERRPPPTLQDRAPVAGDGEDREVAPVVEHEAAVGALGLEGEPVEPVGPERELVGALLDGGELGGAEQLGGHRAPELMEVEAARGREPREVGHHQHDVVAVAPDEGQHLAVLRVEELDLSRDRTPGAGPAGR